MEFNFDTEFDFNLEDLDFLDIDYESIKAEPDIEALESILKDFSDKEV